MGGTLGEGLLCGGGRADLDSLLDCWDKAGDRGHTGRETVKSVDSEVF